ncbi:MAG: aminodeoxychorismate/anthranilate synthase component II [Clostridium sp.]|nr:aminodeoxychorismate/anthranilate synthase component II [Clostridium sp.]
MKVLLVDAFDSFVFVIAQYYEKLGGEARVVRVNENPLELYREWKPDLLVLGPGPGTPTEHGYLKILEEISENQAVFGVCLGLQAIGEYFGWKLVNAPAVKHGKKSIIDHDGKGIFLGIKSKVSVVRYHSLAITNLGSSRDLIITAKSEEDNVVMGIRHKNRPIEAVQFHPESVGTEYGLDMIKNSLQLIQE